MKVCGKDLQIRGRLLRISHLDADSYESLNDPEAVLGELRKSGIRSDLFTFMQILPDTSPKYDYPMEWDNVAALQVSTYDTWWTKQVDSKTRNMVRRAEKKGVEVREVAFDDALVQGIWEVYNECPVRQGKPFRHYGEDLETVRREEATFLDSSIFIGAFLGNRLIGFVKLTWDQTRSQANVMNIVSMMQHRDKAPTNALIAQAVRFCAERGIPHLLYQSFSYGKRQRDTLSDFKENNGFERIDVPRYYIPLTRIGWAAFRLGLHHRFADHIPESAMAKLRELRKAWYERKAQVIAEAR